MRAATGARVALALLAGAGAGTSAARAQQPEAPLDGPRLVWWNFVSSRKERIEDAKRAWAERRMGMVPGDTEWIPLPA